MILKDFEADYKNLRERIDNILINKRKEYADNEEDGDRLSNFKAPCSSFKTNQAMVCLYYASKHWEACIKIAQDIDKGIYPTRDLLHEKVQDISAYMALYHACVMEELQENESSHNGKVKVKVKPAVFERADLQFEDTDTLL